MVDVVLLQSASYVAAAIGVCVAAVYYVMNLRETGKNRKIAFTNNFMQSFMTLEAERVYIELMHMKWSSFEDFEKKYDSTINEDNYAKRDFMFSWCDRVGWQLKAGLIDRETFYQIMGEWIMLLWMKFKPIFYHYREIGEMSEDDYGNFEYASREMARMKLERSPKWRGKASWGDYEDAFGKL